MRLAAQVSREDLRQLERAMTLISRRYDHTVSRRVMGDLLQRSITPLERGIRDRTPRVTGILASSVRSRARQRRGSVYADAGYVARGSAARKRHIFAAALTVEYGNTRTVRPPAQPLRRALSATRKSVIAKFRRLMRLDLLRYAEQVRAQSGRGR